MRERVGGPVRHLLALAIGVGLGASVMSLRETVNQPPQPVEEKAPQRAKLPLIEIQEPSTLVEFIPVFEEVYSILEKAGLKVTLPIQPKSYALNRYGVIIARGAPNYMETTLTKSDFPGYQLLREVKIGQRNSENNPRTYQIMDSNPNNPNISGLSGEDWQYLGRTITKQYNNFAREYDGITNLVILTPTLLPIIPGIKSA